MAKLITYIFVISFALFLSSYIIKPEIAFSITELAHMTFYEEKGKLHATQYYKSSHGTIIYTNCFEVKNCDLAPCSSTDIFGVDIVGLSQMLLCIMNL